MSTFQISIGEATPIYRPQPRPCTCPSGFSSWHLLALGLLVDQYVVEFAKTLYTIPHGELIDDLRESTWQILPLPFYQAAFRKRHGFALARANRLILYRNVKQLCRLTGVPLFGYYPIPPRDIHPVVKAFNACLDLPKGGGRRSAR